MTMLAMAGVALVKAQKLARHSTPNLTANTYTRLQVADLRLEIEKLPPPPEVKARDHRFVLGLAQTAAHKVQDRTAGVSEEEVGEGDNEEENCRAKSLDQNMLGTVCQLGTSAVREVPKVGLEPTPSCEDRILSPVRLPFPWYWKHVGVTLKVCEFKAVTMPPLRCVHCSRIGLILPILLPICCQIGLVAAFLGNAPPPFLLDRFSVCTYGCIRCKHSDVQT